MHVPLRAALFLLSAGAALAAAGQSTPQPTPLWAGGAPLSKGSADADTPTLTAYLPAQNPTRTAVVIAPGGGYQHLSMQKEGEDIARWLNARGVAGFVLKYRLGPTYHHPAELADAQRSIRSVRSHAAALGLAPDHIGFWGFSAGGHLAASAGTLYDLPAYPPVDAIDKESARPDFLVLAYPVVTMEDAYVHGGSRLNLLGNQPDPALIQLLSPEKHVTATTPPTFLFATTDDPVVPAQNSILFYSALMANKVSAELHIFAHGPHGVGLAPGFADLKGWPDLLAAWMCARSLMAAAPPI